MKTQRYSQELRKIFSILSPALLLILFLPSHIMAQPSSLKVSVNFPTGDPKGTPARTAGGGKRGNSLCLKLNGGKPTLTALMPTRENKSFTLAKQPDFYFYIPSTNAKTGEFILRNENEEDIVKTEFQLPEKPGIVKVQIPPSVALETGSTYKWYFTIVCNENDRSADEYTEGTIERTVISPSVQTAIEKAQPLKQAEIYAKYDIWPETITNVLKIRQQQPTQWTGLLRSVGLEVIADEPIQTMTKLPEKP